MSDKKAVFDAEQGHGDHLDSILDGIDIQDFLQTVPNLVNNAGVICKTAGKIKCNFGENYPPEIEFALLGDTENSGRVSFLLGCEINNERHELLSFYPEYDGAEIEMKLTAIHEWANGVEATLEGSMLNGERKIAFFDTRYCINKGKYRIGENYLFKVSAFSYNNIEILKDPSFKFEGDAAVDFLRKTGENVEYEADGSVKPIVFHTDKMVAFLQTSGEYPHLAEFQSPIFSSEEKQLFNGIFYKLDIAIAQDNNEEQIIIPLIAKKSLFKEVPKENNPLRGMLWMQGYCTASAVDSENKADSGEVKVPVDNIKDLDYDITKDDPGFSDLNNARKDVFNQIYQAWMTLDDSYFKECLTPDFEYGSFWVEESMFGADTYVEYVAGKFDTIRKSHSAPSVEQVLLHSGKFPVDYNYALLMHQGDNQSLLLFTFDGNKICKLYMTDPQFYQFVPCVIPIVDRYGEPEIFHSPKKFFKRGEMSEKDFQAFVLDSYGKILKSRGIKVKKCIICPEKSLPHMILEAEGKTVYLLCDIFTPPYSEGRTHLNKMKDFAQYVKKQKAVPALAVLGMFCLDTNGQKAIYNGNFAMKANRMVLLQRRKSK